MKEVRLLFGKMVLCMIRVRAQIGIEFMEQNVGGGRTMRSLALRVESTGLKTRLLFFFFLSRFDRDRLYSSQDNILEFITSSNIQKRDECHESRT